MTDSAPSLLAIPGCGILNAAKILVETADIRRFGAKSAYTRYNGTVPLPVWSGNRARIDSAGPAIANSTQPCTGWPSRRRTTTQMPHLSPKPASDPSVANSL
ncbi:transposase [Streptomyces sp. NPDC088794]|uniref:transposase n=1 Tax=Streptomyces sp. NPDC088794 TaxID=3365902 RepID=UPI0038214D0D